MVGNHVVIGVIGTGTTVPMDVSTVVTNWIAPNLSRTTINATLFDHDGLLLLLIETHLGVGTSVPY
jgi:hypothetical protein